MSSQQTFAGGRTATVKLLDGTSAEVLVRQLPLGQYEAAFKLLAADDEIGFVALVCDRNKDKDWAEKISPESYEELYLAATEVNAQGFFSWKARRDSRAQERESQRLAREAGAEATKMIVLRQAEKPSILQPGSPAPQPRQV